MATEDMLQDQVLRLRFLFDDGPNWMFNDDTKMFGGELAKFRSYDE